MACPRSYFSQSPVHHIKLSPEQEGARGVQDASSPCERPAMGPAFYPRDHVVRTVTLTCSGFGSLTQLSFEVQDSVTRLWGKGEDSMAAQWDRPEDARAGAGPRKRPGQVWWPQACQEHACIGKRESRSVCMCVRENVCMWMCKCESVMWAGVFAHGYVWVWVCKTACIYMCGYVSESTYTCACEESTWKGSKLRRFCCPGSLWRMSVPSWLGPYNHC